MRTLRKAALVLTGVLAALTWVWVAAVRAVPDVRRRKAEQRARRRGG